MKKSNSHLAIGTMLAVMAAAMLLPGTSSATLPIQKKAKDLGFPATNCQYCHVEKLPKKDAVSHNERGQWLIAEKTKRAVKEVDPAWLKDYPGDKK